MLQTDKNSAICEQQNDAKDTNSPHGNGMAGHNVKWARGTKDVTGQPGNEVSK